MSITGDGVFVDESGAPDERKGVALERLAQAGVSIASSLVALTMMLREDRRRRERALRSLAQYLVDEAHRAEAAASRADDMLRRPMGDARSLREFAERREREAALAWSRLDLFRAAYPDVAVPHRPSWETRDVREDAG